MNAFILLFAAALPGQASPLACDAALVDRGQIRGGPVLTQRFILTNHGQSDVTILEARASCGCLTPRLSTRSLRTGESATLDLEIGTVSQPEGDNLWTVFVAAQEAGRSAVTLELKVKATIVREVGLEPAAVRLFGGPGLVHEITLTDRRAKPLDGIAVGTASKRLVAEADPWKPGEAGWTRKIRVRLAPDCPAGRFEDVVQIVSADPEYRELRVPVSGERRDKQRYLATPGEVRLEVKAGRPTAGFLVLVREHEGQPIEIDRVVCDDPALATRFADGANATAAVRVSVVKERTPLPSSQVHIHLRAPVPQVLTIPVTVR